MRNHFDQKTSTDKNHNKLFKEIRRPLLGDCTSRAAARRTATPHDPAIQRYFINNRTQWIEMIWGEKRIQLTESGAQELLAKNSTEYVMTSKPKSRASSPSTERRSKRLMRSSLSWLTLAGTWNRLETEIREPVYIFTDRFNNVSKKSELRLDNLLNG
jgi:hypothetical protein